MRNEVQRDQNFCLTAKAVPTERSDFSFRFNIDKILKADGWYVVGTKGSHYQYEHAVKKGKVTVPRHNKDFSIKTAKSILKQAGLE